MTLRNPRYRGRTRYYSGSIQRVRDDDGTYDIKYDDGEVERMVEPSLIKLLDSASGIFSEGDKLS